MSVDNVLLAAAGLLNSGSGGGGASGGDRPLPVGSAGKYVGYNSSGAGVAITPDSTPTNGSNRLVTSDGVYDALATKQDKLTFDLAPTENSPNSLTSGAVYDALDNLPSGGGVALPDVSASDNGKVLTVVNGEWDKAAAPSGGGSGGLSNDAKEALLALLEKVAYIDESGEEYYSDLEDALYGTTTTGITAVFSPGQTEFVTTDTLESLRQYLTVTLNKSNGTSKPVSDYTLSGTLTRGASVITVTYRSYTTTFTVNVTGEVLMWQGYSANGTREDYPPQNTGENMPFFLFANPDVVPEIDHTVPYVVGSPITSFELEIVTAGTFHVGKINGNTYCVGQQETVVPLSAITNIKTFNLSTGFQKIVFSEPIYLAQGEVLCFGLPEDTARHRWANLSEYNGDDAGFAVRDCVNQATLGTFWNLKQVIGINVYRG